VTLVWLNGTFGVGKTTTAGVLSERFPRWRSFDPETVGVMLRANLQGRSFGGDFQNLPAWRRLVPLVAHELMQFTGQELVAVQTVLVEQYWRELTGGLAEHGIGVFHVVLDAELDVLRERIENDVSHPLGPAAIGWRLEHLPAFALGRAWMLEDADLVIDTTFASPDDIAAAIAKAVPD
jgi:hypothetical protein